MGDAYLCCGWLPDMATLSSEGREVGDGSTAGARSWCCARVGGRGEEQADPASSVTHACHEEQSTVYDALLLARRILAAVKKRSTDCGARLDVRIGIGTGECVAGIMGQLQSRFHILGPAISAADELERRALRGHINVNALTFSLLRPVPVTGGGARGPNAEGQLYESETVEGLWKLVADVEVPCAEQLPERHGPRDRARARETETLGYWFEGGAEPEAVSARSYQLVPFDEDTSVSSGI